MEQRTLTCPNCGREIQVPAELEEFSCVYCGAKHSLSALTAPSQADEADRRYAEAHLLDCIRDYPEYFRKFGRKTYAESFETYRTGMQETFLAMDRYICAQPMRRQALLEAFTEQFLADWESFHRQDRRWNRKTSREQMLFESKLTLAWYAVPAIRSLGSSTGRDFTDLLQKKFAEKYPLNLFQCAEYEDIANGFQKHKLCFITTAVCEFEGKPDDGAELTAFRAFRDGWLAKTEEGRALTEEYYELAPVIVSAIDYCDDRAARYTELRRDWLRPCYEALRRGDNETCRRTYVNMVHTLRRRYGL